MEELDGCLIHETLIHVYNSQLKEIDSTKSKRNFSFYIFLGSRETRLCFPIHFHLQAVATFPLIDSAFFLNNPSFLQFKHRLFSENKQLTVLFRSWCCSQFNYPFFLRKASITFAWRYFQRNHDHLQAMNNYTVILF